MTIIPFSIKNERGAISVRVTSNAGAKHSGFDILGPMKEWNLKGFPVMKATVTFEGTGYRAILGWIQIVHLDFRSDGRKKIVVDVVPSHIGLGVPFAYFGHLPTLFDSPARHPRSSGSFTAEAFLCKPPLLERNGPIEFIAGFRWGYKINGISEELTQFPVKRIGASAWAKHRGLITKKYPKWKLGRGA
ncbi:MAG: hypothetical protein HYX59_09755 [Elusimicrobia bacterium]|nr:hypothetical protein [Elusimicrobiota bacterium]